MGIFSKIVNILSTSGFSDFTLGNFIMIVIAGILLTIVVYYFTEWIFKKWMDFREKHEAEFKLNNILDFPIFRGD